MKKVVQNPVYTRTLVLSTSTTRRTDGELTAFSRAKNFPERNFIPRQIDNLWQPLQYSFRVLRRMVTEMQARNNTRTYTYCRVAIHDKQCQKGIGKSLFFSFSAHFCRNKRPLPESSYTFCSLSTRLSFFFLLFRNISP